MNSKQISETSDSEFDQSIVISYSQFEGISLNQNNEEYLKLKNELEELKLKSMSREKDFELENEKLKKENETLKNI